MAKRILSISFLEDAYQFMEIDKQTGGFFAQAPVSASTEEAMLAACREANEIYIGAALPTALYEWETFPKVAKKYLGNLVRQDAREKSGSAAEFHVQYKAVEDVVVSGVTKSWVSYIAVPEADLEPIWTTFEKFMKKVKIIAPLSVTLASTVVKSDKPANDFMVLWAGERATAIVISSPNGVVKMARTVPFGIPRELSALSAEELGRISEELDKEISMTTTFFKQEFRAAVPGAIYFLGNNHLENLFRDNPLTNAPQDQRFKLSASLAKGLSDDQINENIHLIGNIFLGEDFNFLPVEAVIARKPETGYWIAIAAMALIILAAGFWTVQKSAVKQDRLAEYDRQMSEAQKLQKVVVDLRQKVNQLKPFEGWKIFYEDTFQNRPAWNMILSEFSILTPDYIILDEFNLETPNQGARTASATTQTPQICEVTGRIQAKNYEDGLNKFREYGISLQASSIFEVLNVRYSPEGLEGPDKLFRFSISLRLTPQGSAHAS